MGNSFSKFKYTLYKYFEFDRAGERAVKKSIARWHKGGWLNHAFARQQWNKIRKNIVAIFSQGLLLEGI